MSIQKKLAIAFSIIVSAILILNNSLNYFSTKEVLLKDQQKQMEAISKEIRIAIEHSQYGNNYVENLLGTQLRTAAIAAHGMLDPDIKNVTNEQLVEVAERVGVSHITLFARVDDDIMGLKSSDPKEIDLSTKDWGYWHDALDQLLRYRSVKVLEGQTLDNYWSGPMGVASSDPTHTDKWGYYYDGSTNYIINTYFRDQHVMEFDDLTGPKAFVDKSLKENPSLLEITAFNPQAFGEEPILTRHNGAEYVELQDRAIYFGNYTYQDEAQDVESVRKAFETGERVSYQTEVGGRQVIKNFMTIYSDKMYVIGIVTDYAVVQAVLNDQLFRNVLISLGLILLVLIGSSYLARYIVRPLQAILEGVYEISVGRLHTRVEINRSDELGELAEGINAMSQNLQSYTDELRSLFQHNSAAIFQISLEGQFLTLNPVAEKAIGYTLYELRGMSIFDLVTSAGTQTARTHFEHAIDGEHETYVLPILHKDGHEIQLGITNFPIYVDEQIVGIYWSAKDITEIKKTEELLRKSDKLALVGQLAAGVAHEIRNPLTSIKGFVQLIQQTTQTKKEYIEIMLSELDRIEFIMNEFLVLAKPQATNFQYKDLNVLLQNITALVETQAIMSNVQIEAETVPNLPLVMCEENQLKQVFINILKNSIEAMPRGGKISISVHQTEEQVLLRFVDQGSGIPPERIPKLGEPFYTTKEKGTGLGLMISYKIINEHKGKIQISSELDKGTTVEVFLPFGDEQSRSDQ